MSFSRYLRYLENDNSDPPPSIIKPYSVLFEKKKKMFYFLRVKVFIQEKFQKCPTDVYEVRVGWGGGGGLLSFSRCLRYLENDNSNPPPSIIKPYSVSF